MLVRMWRKGNLLALFKLKLVQSLWKIKWRCLKKLKLGLPMIQQSHFWVYTQKKGN